MCHLGSNQSQCARADKGYLKRFEEENQNLLRTTEAAKPFLDAFKEMYLELFNRGPDFKL
jgi:hypothetical protein